jgi:hypothetical protein
MPNVDKCTRKLRSPTETAGLLRVTANCRPKDRFPVFHRHHILQAVNLHLVTQTSRSLSGYVITGVHELSYGKCSVYYVVHLKGQSQDLMTPYLCRDTCLSSVSGGMRVDPAKNKLHNLPNMHVGRRWVK